MVTMSPLNTVLDRMVTLSRAMDEALGGEMTDGGNGQVWVPAIDAWETENAFTVQLDLPGVTPESVDLSFDRNVLTVRGTRPSTVQPREKEERRVFFAERAYGSFARSLRFPQFVEADKIEAAVASRLAQPSGRDIPAEPFSAGCPVNPSCAIPRP